MPDVFINYRTGDGEKSATLIETRLSDRFGSERIFRASKSIKPSEPFPPALLRAVRRSSILLAVIGSQWAAHPRLRNHSDWVRKELLEACEMGIPILPVLDGRTVDRLSADALPEELAHLADLQSLRLDHQNADADLARIGDTLAELVPELGAADRHAREREDGAPDGVGNSISGGTQGTAVQTRDFNGTVGTSFYGARGPVHTGNGNQYVESQHFSGPVSGDGATYVTGDVNGGIKHRFGGKDDREDDGR
ncbi:MULTISPECIES: toll/interleukin-1 receptor domain-containing protein [Streptomyces]|uniref:toll/interleukin-1 receptor domain-containing protein n=1 Tax=Streptomyces TaxID=1883 RepID=UPI00345BB4DC